MKVIHMHFCILASFLSFRTGKLAGAFDAADDFANESCRIRTVHQRGGFLNINGMLVNFAYRNHRIIDSNGTYRNKRGGV